MVKPTFQYLECHQAVGPSSSLAVEMRIRIGGLLSRATGLSRQSGPGKPVRCGRPGSFEGVAGDVHHGVREPGRQVHLDAIRHAVERLDEQRALRAAPPVTSRSPDKPAVHGERTSKVVMKWR